MWFLFSMLISITAQAEKISDNSFLLEEAYNQDPGIVQFIQSYQYNKIDKQNSVGAYALTIEMPLYNHTHQISLTAPYQTLETAGAKTSGLADTMLNYRYQVIDRPELAIAPRLSLLMPSGKREDGLGTGHVGIQVNTAVSIEVNKQWMNHWNFGFTNTPDAKTVGTNFATSFVYLYSDTLNFIIEFIHNSNESANLSGIKTRAESYYVNPGVRWAYNLGETQIVPGISFPTGISASADEFGVLAYLSVETKVW